MGEGSSTKSQQLSRKIEDVSRNAIDGETNGINMKKEANIVNDRKFRIF